MKPYQIVGNLQRFDQRNTAFARSRWDETSPAYGKAPRSAEQIAAEGKPGCRIEDFALHAGAWAVHREKPLPGDTAARPEEMEVAGRSSPEAYQVDDWGVLTRQLKQAARFYGASLVGVTRVNPLWVYAAEGEEELAHEDGTA